MAQRVVTLTSYLFRDLLLSLTGILYIIMTLVFWRIFFDPAQGTPEGAYYVLVIGLFGAGMAFLATLSVAARAHRAIHYPLLARLSSRVEHLAAVLLSALAFAFLLQGATAALALFRGPEISLGLMLEIPPLWIAVNVLAAVLALHASDLVTAGWSRVAIYGALALLLFGRELNTSSGAWIGERLSQLSGWLFQRGWSGAGNVVNRLSQWSHNSAVSSIGDVLDVAFWPFHAIAEAVKAGAFEPRQALAPAILLLYATVLFLLAADFFSTKDLFLTE